MISLFLVLLFLLSYDNSECVLCCLIVMFTVIKQQGLLLLNGGDDGQVAIVK